MQNIRRALFALSFVSVTTASLLAQAGADGAGRGPRRGPPGGPGRLGGSGLPPIFLALDTDKSGDISAAEMASAPVSLKHLDVNGDGIFSTEELRSLRPAGSPPTGARPRPALPLMLALDANADGVISDPEIANASASLRALDANKDGKLTRDELHPLPRAGN